MDGISAMQSVIALAQQAYQLYLYVQSVKDAPEERKGYADELLAVKTTLEGVAERLKNAGPNTRWSKHLLQLAERGYWAPGESSRDSKQIFLTKPTRNDYDGKLVFIPDDTKDYQAGPLLRGLNDMLEEVERKLTEHEDSTKGKLRKTTHSLTWFWSSSDMKDLFFQMGRRLNTINLVEIQDDRILARDTNVKITESLNRQNQKDDRKEREKIIEWLSPVQAHKRQQEVLEDSFRAEEWLAKEEEFRWWTLGRPWTLWCYGEPGVGKTVLMSNIIAYLQKQAQASNNIVLFLYLDHKDPFAQKSEVEYTRRVLGSLLKQVVQYQETGPLALKLREIFHEAKDGAGPKLDDILTILKSELEKFDVVHVILDGYDEIDAEKRKRLLRHLELNVRGMLDNVSVMVTSRVSEAQTRRKEVICDHCNRRNPRVYYMSRLGSLQVCQWCVDNDDLRGHRMADLKLANDRVHIFLRAPDSIIREYIEYELMLDARYSDGRNIDQNLGSLMLDAGNLTLIIREDDKLEHEIPALLVRKAQGSFQLARLYLNSLKASRNISSLRQALKNLPEDLDSVYEQAINRIQKQRKADREFAWNILLWVTSARRPLSLPELKQAMAMVEDDGMEIYNRESESQDQTFISTTMGLVVIDAERSSVRLHLTLQTWMEKTKGKVLEDVERQIAEVIIRFLNLDDFAQACKTNIGQDSTHARVAEFPFLAYASQYFGHHIQKCCNDAEIQESLLALLTNSGKLASWIQVASYCQLSGWSDLDIHPGANALHVCASYGLDALISLLIDDVGHDVNEKDQMYKRTPIAYACRRGHSGTVAKILAYTDDADPQDIFGVTPLLEAVVRSSPETTKVLLAAKVDINARHRMYFNRTPLMLAAIGGLEHVDVRERGHEQEQRVHRYKQIAQQLLCHPNVDANMKDADGYTALNLAIRYQHPEILELLINHKYVQIDITDNIGSTALLTAARLGDAQSVEKLLMKGADPSIKNFEGGGTAFRKAVDENRLDVVRMMLKHKDKVDCMVVDDRNRSLLHSACINGRVEIAELLIDVGLDVNARGSHNETPLHDACRVGCVDVVSLLLKHDATQNLKDTFDRTPFDVAWQHGHTQLMNILVRQQNRNTVVLSRAVNDRSDRERPTWSLAKLGLFPLILELCTQAPEKLLDHDPDSGDTALHYAVITDRPKILERLLAAGMSPDVTNKSQRTPLHLSALLAKPQYAAILLKFSPKLDVADEWHQTPLKIAQLGRRWRIVIALLEHDAALDRDDRALLQKSFFAAVELNSVKATERLIQTGVDTAALDQYGQTARMIAIDRKADAVLDVLESRKMVVAFK